MNDKSRSPLKYTHNPERERGTCAYGSRFVGACGGLILAFFAHITDGKVHGANMGPIWGRQDPGGPHVGPMFSAIWDHTELLHWHWLRYFYDRPRASLSISD